VGLYIQLPTFASIIDEHIMDDRRDGDTQLPLPDENRYDHATRRENTPQLERTRTGGPPFAFRKTVSARSSNTTPVRPLRVKIQNLGCPVLDVFQGRGFWFDSLCLNYDLQFPLKERRSKAPPVTPRDRWGTRKF
jgi:hypothetical protein